MGDLHADRGALNGHGDTVFLRLMPLLRAPAPLTPGEVVFTGTVTDSPNCSFLLRDAFEGTADVFTFDVESVTRGDPMDGRVYTSSGHGGCGRVFELGATYRVHADVVDPDAKYLGRRPGVLVSRMAN